ncbi:E3 ubiquitin-protein ligase MARCH6 [Trichoplax sp. H2]|nr:E3 ubiquitin-protein ligase MARCH6 [Trichoplax sp. H2]|eukprot:RDD45014.1 E3 ubiquitin-protein ligase MARCH6 [Trichoplax sp. H2]
MEIEENDQICRVCRLEGSTDKPLYFPCHCTGSIKYIHEACLLQWLKHSGKDFCELCRHKFAFKPVYAKEMPSHLPIREVLTGFMSNVIVSIKRWIQYVLVCCTWLCIVPVAACRIYKSVFRESLSGLIGLPINMFSLDNFATDCAHGLFIVCLTVSTFVGLIWLREQINESPPPWLVALPNANINRQEPVNEEHRNHDVNVDNAGGDVGEANNTEDNQIPAPPVNQQGNNVGNAERADNDSENSDLDMESSSDTEDQRIDLQNNFENPDVQVNRALPNVAAVDDLFGEENNNRNWLELEREELTWDKILGLDGSYTFIEHAFWVVSLNFLLIFILAYIPYKIGCLGLYFLPVEYLFAATRFGGFLTIILGYVTIATFFSLLYISIGDVQLLSRWKRFLGITVIAIKVSLLLIVEVGIFPVVCGWWLDICSLPLFGSTMEDRQKSFRSSPGAAMFLHWLVGMVFVFYMASFVLLLREVLRPGVLWFLRNINDPDFNPITEMIQLTIWRHIRRFLASVTIFGTSVLVIVWIPVRISVRIFPGLLPYNVLLFSDTPASELSLELLFLQVILPALLEQGYTKKWTKSFIRIWSRTVGYILDLQSYLLGHENEEGSSENNRNDAEFVPEVNNDAGLAGNIIPGVGFGGGIGAAHAAGAAIFNRRVLNNSPYRKPNQFILRIIALLLIMCVSVCTISLLGLTVPVYLGRYLLSLWLGDTAIHELYTVACGLYAVWLICRIITLIVTYMPMQWYAIFDKIRNCVVLVLKLGTVTVLLAGVVPLLVGLLFELIILVPVRVSLNQSPMYFLWQDWTLGVLHTKIICALTMTGPDWWMKLALDQIHNAGFRNLDFAFVIKNLAFPVISMLLFLVTAPITLASGASKLFGLSKYLQNYCIRRIYPFSLLICVAVITIKFHIKQAKRLYNRIRDDKYLIGQRLVNYEP